MRGALACRHCSSPDQIDEIRKYYGNIYPTVKGKGG